MTITVELGELLEGFDKALHEAELWQGVSNFLSPRYVKAYIYHNLPAIGATDYATPYSYQETLNISPNKNCELKNPSFEKLLRENVRPLVRRKFWGDWTALKTKSQSIDETLSSFSNVFEGVSIPVHGPSGRNGCFSLEFSDSNFSRQDIEIQIMQWVCQYAHQNFCRLLTNQKTKLPHLTVREKQILTWIALGKSNADIAEILGISYHTVGTYTRRVFVKTNTDNRTSAALFGISNGLIDV